MNPIVRTLWDRGLNLRKWAKINNFSYRYVELVVAGKRGKLNVGVAKKIRDTLVGQGFATTEDFYKEV
jgi:hypothetical protein